MAIWTCEQCQITFKRDKSGDKPIRFCGVRCYHVWRKENGITAGQFKKGQSPWNKNLKGIHLSPASEWKPGQDSNRKLPVGSVTTRRNKRERFPRAFVKVAEPNVWRQRAVVVWEMKNGPLPKGWVVHHIDRDPLNDSPSNLEGMSRAEHIKEHRGELLEARDAA